MKRILCLVASFTFASALQAGPLPTASADQDLHLDSLSSRTIVADGEHTVTLTGTGFGPGASVLFGHNRITPEDVTATSLTVRVPKLPAGTVPVTVERDGQRTESTRDTALALHAASEVANTSAPTSSPAGARIRAAAVTTVTDPNLVACLSDALGLAEGSTPTAVQIAGITELNCQSHHITSLQGLQQATGLRSLEVSNNSLTSLEPLRPLTSLQRVWAASNAISDLSPLSAKPRLVLLDVSSNAVASLDGLATDTNLQELVIDDNAITSLAPLTRLTSLQTIHASFNQVTSLAPLGGLPLRELHLWGNRVSSLTPLSSRTGMQHLDVSYNAVGSLAPLASLTGMQQLNLEGNTVADLSPLSRMTSLTQLNANANRLRSVAPIAGLTKLYWVFLRNNCLLDLSPLKAFTTPTIEAEGQRVALPLANSTTTGVRILDRRGAPASVTGASLARTGLVWPGTGARSATFSDSDQTFTGTITQTVRPAERFGDASDDGLADLFTIEGSRMMYRPGRGSSFGGATVMAGDWSTTTALAPMHDITGDRMFELMSRDTAGSLWMHPVTGPARLGVRKQIGRNWNGMSILAPAGRLAGGNTQYVVARRSDGSLFRYTVTPTGLTGITQIGWRWNGMRQVVAVGDWTGDGREDLMGLRQDGTLWLYEATAKATLKTGREVGHGWSGFSIALSPGDLSGDTVVDLVGLRRDGTLFGYQNVRSTWGAAKQMATGLTAVRLMA